MEYLIGRKRVRPDPQQAIGKGGEADVFNVGGVALKIFKPPSHPDFDGLPGEQKNAQRRIEEHQRKLPSFPDDLPERIIVPIDLAYGRDRRIAGYTMQLLAGSEPMLSFAMKQWRQDNPQVTY